MRPRSWDVGTRGATAGGPISATAFPGVARVVGLAAALMVLAAACGPHRYAAPPAPDFTRGQPAIATQPSEPPESTVPASASEPAEVRAGSPSPDRAERFGGVPATGDEPVVGTDEGEPAPADPGNGSGGPDGSLSEADIASMVVVDDVGVVVPNESGWAAFDAALSRRLIPADVSASVAVMVDGQVVHQAAFGERVAGSGEPADVTDRFRIASISKTITAIVVMQLVEAGRLTLDDPIGQLVIDHLGVAPSDPEAAAITVRQLLTHTAGFGKYQSTFFGHGAVSYADAARIGMSGSVSPGSSFAYSNMNYAVLSVLIEAVTGQAYERVVGDRLLTPLGITDMRMAGTHELGPDEVSHHPTPGRNFMETLGGAGAWNATPTQVVTIYNSIDPLTPGWKALSLESMALMRNGVATGSPTASYGFGIFNYGGGAWGHTGTIERSHSMVLVQPDGVTWAVSVSGETPSSTGALQGMVRAALTAGFTG